LYVDEFITVKKQGDTEIEEELYRIKSVILHDGLTPDSGHYTSMVRINETWFVCNDQWITPSRFEDIDEFLPYIVIYEKC